MMLIVQFYACTHTSNKHYVGNNMSHTADIRE